MFKFLLTMLLFSSVSVFALNTNIKTLVTIKTLNDFKIIVNKGDSIVIQLNNASDGQSIPIADLNSVNCKFVNTKGIHSCVLETKYDNNITFKTNYSEQASILIFSLKISKYIFDNKED